MFLDFPGGPVVESHLPVQGTWAPSWSRITAYVPQLLSFPGAVATEAHVSRAHAP